MKRGLMVFWALLIAALLSTGATLWALDADLASQVDASAQSARETASSDQALFPGWLIDLSAGYLMNQGNSDTQNLLARAAAIKKFEETWELIARGEYAWGKVKDQDTRDWEKTADRGSLSAQGNFFLIEDGFLYGRSEISYDKVKDLDRRLDNGIGAGYNLYRNDETFASVEAGVTYIDSKFRYHQRDHGLYLRLAQSGALKINEMVTLLESVEYKPKFEDFNDYLLTAEAALRASLNSHLYFQLTLTDRYDNNPAAGVKPNDLSIIASLGLSI